MVAATKPAATQALGATDATGGWARQVTEDGQVYYYHAGSGASQWHLPNELYVSQWKREGEEAFEPQSSDTQVIFPCEAQARLKVSCVTEVMPEHLGGAGAASRVNQMLRMLEENVSCIEELKPQLPDWLKDVLDSDNFLQECYDQYGRLDDDGSGQLEAQELYPVILDLCQEHPLTINLEHCQRLMTIFDADNNGTLSRDEFVQFVQFLYVYMFLMQSSIE